MTYERLFPSSVRSYHVLLETDYEVRVRRAVLTDERQQEVIAVLAGDLKQAAQSDLAVERTRDVECLDDQPIRLSPHEKYDRLLRYELQRELGRASEVLAQRQSERVAIVALLPDRPELHRCHHRGKDCCSDAVLAGQAAGRDAAAHRRFIDLGEEPRAHERPRVNGELFAVRP